MRSYYLLLGVIFFISCNKIPDCTDCQAEVYINDTLFEFDNVRAYGLSSSPDRFTLNFSRKDDFGIVRDGFSVDRIPKSEGVYQIAAELDTVGSVMGRYTTYISDGDVLGLIYKPDLKFEQSVEILNWNPDEGFVEGQLIGTYMTDGGPAFDPDTLVINTNLFKIQWEGNRE